MPSVKCAVCGKPLLKKEPRMLANGRRYHADCYSSVKKHLKK